MEEFKKVISKKWTERAPTFDDDHATEDITLWRETLEELICRKGNGSVLDIGTGTGFLANMISELGYCSVGIEFSEGMLEVGRQNTARRGTAVEYILGDGETLPFADNTFDAVVNCRVLWLLLDPVNAIKEWKRVLKPGGAVLSFVRITTPEEKAQMLSDTSGKMRYPKKVVQAMPLMAAAIDAHLAAYQDAGFHNPEAILLRRDLSLQEGAKPWYAFRGVKEQEPV